MISVDGYTMIPRKAKAGYEWSCTGEWKVVRIPGRSTWKRDQGKPGSKDLTKPERVCAHRQRNRLRSVATS